MRSIQNDIKRVSTELQVRDQLTSGIGLELNSTKMEPERYTDVLDVYRAELRVFCQYNVPRTVDTGAHERAKVDILRYLYAEQRYIAQDILSAIESRDATVAGKLVLALIKSMEL